MHFVGTGFGDNVNRRAACAAQFRRVIAPIYLKLLHRVLVQIEPDAASIIVEFTPIDSDTVPSAVAPVE